MSVPVFEMKEQNMRRLCESVLASPYHPCTTRVHPHLRLTVTQSGWEVSLLSSTTRVGNLAFSDPQLEVFQELECHPGERAPSPSIHSLCFQVTETKKLSKLDPPPAQPQFPLLAICLAIAIAFVLEMGRGVPWPFQDILAGKWEHQPPAGLGVSCRGTFFYSKEDRQIGI
ncbi:hypothetical protein B0H14DRAFT_2587440 [Mycena olivaceomarginata]|nr:hypothetical protein B0H14DRAFT_2587440 [Mycena olivaceomarginata]